MLLPAVSVGAAEPPDQAPGRAPGQNQQHTGPTTTADRPAADWSGGLVAVDGSVLASAAAVLADVAAGRSSTTNVRRLAGILSDVLHAAARSR